MGALIWVFYYVAQASFEFVMFFVPASQEQGLRVGCFVVVIWFVVYIYTIRLHFPGIKEQFIQPPATYLLGLTQSLE